MKIIKDSICCKNKIIEKQTGENKDVIVELPKVAPRRNSFKNQDAMKIICNLDRFKSGDNIYITGDVNIHGMINDSGKKYLKFEYPIWYLIYKGAFDGNYNYENKEIGKFEVLLNKDGYIFTIRSLDEEFIEKCESIVKNSNIKNCDYGEVEEKVFNNGPTVYINNKLYYKPQLNLSLMVFYNRKYAYWQRLSTSCIEYLEMANISRGGRGYFDFSSDYITNKGFYYKILRDQSEDAKDKKHDFKDGFFVFLMDVNQNCLLGINLGTAMEKFFSVGDDESGSVPRYVITYQDDQEFCKIVFRYDNIHSINYIKPVT